jgi:hypothetical protein
MINWRLRSYSREEFVEAWESSTYYSEVMEKLHLNKSGTAHRIVKDTAKELGLSFELINSVASRNKRNYSLEEILVPNSPYSNNTTLKQRLFREGIKEERCERCGLDEWMGEPLLLTLDHIDGDNRNNSIENLKILCPNCHSQTPTWCGKNKTRKNREYLKQPVSICLCGNEMDKQAVMCLDCYKQIPKETNEYPPSEDMIAGVEKMGMKPYADTLGISDNGLRKVLRRRGIDPLPRRIW